METAILTGIGLAAPAGLNAYIPLLVLALADRATTRVTLTAPYDILSSNLGLAILIVLLTVEVAVDKIPGVDRRCNPFLQNRPKPSSPSCHAAGQQRPVTIPGGLLLRYLPFDRCLRREFCFFSCGWRAPDDSRASTRPPRHDVRARDLSGAVVYPWTPWNRSCCHGHRGKHTASTGAQIRFHDADV